MLLGKVCLMLFSKLLSTQRAFHKHLAEEFEIRS